MAIFSKESLEVLRQRIDLVEVLSPHIELKKNGAAYKALCPFHDEKTPSFTLQRGDSHYHCFGCGAHGDAIQFLMTHVKLSFSEAVQQLANRFNVPLQQVESTSEQQGPNKGVLKAALEHASRIYHFCLLHTAEGAAALEYLYARGIDLDFIRLFQIGLAPKNTHLFRKTMYSKGINDAVLLDAGLLAASQSGGYRDFFVDRIMFPIREPMGSVVGFSARKYKEETFGGKYVNTAETPLFKKSRILFGLNYSRKRIAKERKALVVEGQIDALRLIYTGFNIAVASQGTAFGDGHARELINLGVNHVYIASDGDHAGLEAACKIGNFFQRDGVDVSVLSMPPNTDPDGFICEYGPDAFQRLMEHSLGYIEFLVKHRSLSLNVDAPAGKNELVQMLSKQIREWNSPLMVHESLRQLAHFVQVPESTIGVGEQQQPNLYIKRSGHAGITHVDPDRILEFDCLRWLLLMGESLPRIVEIAHANVKASDFKLPLSRRIYQLYIDNHFAKRGCDLLSLAAELDDAEVQSALSEILERKVNREKAEQHFIDSLQRLLERNWMEIREEVKSKLQSGNCSDDEAMDLAKQFDALKRQLPKVVGA